MRHIIRTVPVVLKLSTARIVMLVFSELIIISLSAIVFYMGFEKQSWGAYGVGFFFLMIAISCLFSFNGRLTLTEEGIEFKNGIKKLNAKWIEIQEFSIERNKMLGWSVIKNGNYSRIGTGDKSIIVKKKFTPGTFAGMSVIQLVDELNRIRRIYQPAPELPMDKKFALGLSALLAEVNDFKHDCLYGDTPIYSLQQSSRQVLAEYWGVSSPDSLKECLFWLNTSGHRESYVDLLEKILEKGSFDDPLELYDKSEISSMKKNEQNELKNKIMCVKNNMNQHDSILAWDFCRLISVARFGAAAGYVSEEEAWEWILNSSEVLKNQFSSWRTMSENYLVGRQFWGDENGRIEIEEAQRYLLDSQNTTSPWITIPWSIKE